MRAVESDMDMNTADRLIDNLIKAIYGAQKAKKRDDKQWWEERVYVAREALFQALTKRHVTSRRRVEK
jgi:hypothetical protein